MRSASFLFAVLLVSASAHAQYMGDGIAGGSGAGVVIQRINSRLRQDWGPCGITDQLIPGMRRAITTARGNRLDIRWEGSAVTNAAATEANMGVSLAVDGVAPEYSAFSHLSETAGGSGANFLVEGSASIYVTPGQHIVELRCHTFTTDTMSFSLLPYSNQQENNLKLTIEEVQVPDWDYTQIPQVAGTDAILVCDLRADQGVTANGSNRVSSWADVRAGSTCPSFVQATSGQQPLLVSNCQNGKPCIRFDPTRVDGLTASLAATTAQRVIFLGNHNHQTTNPILIQCSGANCAIIRLGTSTGGNNDKPDIESGGVKVRTASAVTGKHLLEFRWNTADTVTGIRTDLGLTADRTEETGATINSAGTITGICGADDSSGAGCDLDIYEIQIWQSDANVTKLSTTDDNYIRDMLNKRWAVYTQPSDI